MKMSYSSQLKSHPEKWLGDHLANVALMCKNLVPYHNIAELDRSEIQKIAYLIGASHDVGKATGYFQEYINGENFQYSILKSHSLLSSLYAYYAARDVESEFGQIMPVYVQLIIQSHHGILQSPKDAIIKLYENLNLLKKQLFSIQHTDELERILETLNLPPFFHFKKEIDCLVREEVKSVVKLQQEQQRIFKNPLSPFFLVNLLFSILTDADVMDAANLVFPGREDLLVESVEAHVDMLSKSAKTKGIDLNVLKGREVLFQLLSKKSSEISKETHVMSITAPTGYGKTLAGLNFALRLRKRLSSQNCTPRIIYVAPFLSIIDQNAEVIRNALGVNVNQSNILLTHHHLAEMTYQTSNDADEPFNALESELLVEGWNSEIIVTTFIQFFYSIIGNRKSQLRKFHNLDGSIVILDEVQSIPHKYWKLVRDTVRVLAEKYGMYVILMTATQPLIFESNMVNELVDSSLSLFNKPRVNFVISTNENITLDQFSDKVKKLIESKQCNSILVVMNTIKSATEFFNSLNIQRKKYYLSASVVPKERKERLKDISDDLKKRLPIVLVSTQVVEAGVDLDFDMVIRDIAPIDSIIQVAGRCNRNGSKNSAASPVYIYTVTDKKGREFGRMIYGDFLIEKTKEVLASVGSNPNPTHLASIYYSTVSKGASTLESDKLLTSMSLLDYANLKEFKLIDEQDSASIFIELDNEAEEIWKKYITLLNAPPLKAKEEFLKIRSSFYNYVINTSENKVSEIQKMGGFYYLPRNDVDLFYAHKTGFRE